ncbi:MAG: hypothetical protein ACKPKO_10830, partial [Candidatus Fonsibacter sp.]
VAGIARECHPHHERHERARRRPRECHGTPEATGSKAGRGQPARCFPAGGETGSVGVADETAGR